MEVFLHYILPALISFLIAVWLTPLIRTFALRRGIVDLPDRERKFHTVPTPLLGGIALYLAVAGTSILFLLLGFLQDVRISLLTVVFVLIAGGVLMIGGTLDDRYHLKPWQHVWFPFLAVLVAVVAAGVTIGYITNPFAAGTGPYGRSLLYLNIPFIGGMGAGSMLAVVWLLFTTYATKLLDGLEGLVSGLGVIASIILFLISLFWDVPLSGTSTFIAIFGGACLGFWIYNVRHSYIFLGDGGGMFIGFMLGIFSIISGAKIATTLLVFGLPLLDAVIVVLSRLSKGQNPFSGDRRHLHFKLLDSGMSHHEVLGVYYVFALVFGISAVFLASTDKVIAISVMSLIVVLLALGVTLAQKSRGTRQNGGVV